MADQRSARKKNVKHMCSKPNHFASVCRLKNKTAGETTAQKGHKRVQKVTEETESEDEAIDSKNPLFKIEAISSVKTSGKQFNTKIIFSDPKELYFTELQFQLDTGDARNVMELRDFQEAVR